jgi:hypothetical protein
MQGKPCAKRKFEVGFVGVFFFGSVSFGQAKEMNKSSMVKQNFNLKPKHRPEKNTTLWRNSSDLCPSIIKKCS